MRAPWPALRWFVVPLLARRNGTDGGNGHGDGGTGDACGTWPG
ncbi:hypothetical protein [Streptomyces hydrogenans]